MSNKDAELKISADGSQAESEFDSVASAAEKSGNRIAAAIREASYNGAAASKAATQQMNEHYDKVAEAVEKVKGRLEKMAGLFAIAFGSREIVESVRKVAEYADEVDKSSQKTGIAAEKLQELQFAAKMSDISAQDLDTSLKHLSKAMEGAGVPGNKLSEAFAAVGIKASELKGMGTDEVLKKIADSFANSNDGAGKAAISMELFGKAGADLIPFLNKGSGSMDELAAKAQEMGIVMGGEALEAAGHLDDQFKLLDSRTEAMQRRASMALVPAFLQVTTAFGDATQKGGAMEGVFAGLSDILLLIVKAASYVAQAMNAIGITIGATAAAVVSAVHGDFAAAKQIMNDGDKDIKASAKKFEAFRAALEKPVAVPEHKEPEGEKKKDLHLDNGGKSKTRVSEWKAELEAKHEIEGEYFKTSLADEEAFWQAKAQKSKGNTAESKAVAHELFMVHKQMAQQSFAAEMETMKDAQAAAHVGSTERIELAAQTAKRVGDTYGFESQQYLASIKEVKKAADEYDKEQKKMEDTRTERVRDHSVAMIGMERDALAQKKALGQISDIEEIDQLKILKEKEYQIELVALEKKGSTLQKGTEEYEKHLNDLAKAKDKHSAEMVKLDNSRVLAIQNNWKSMLSAIDNAFEKSITGMIMGTQTMRQAVKNIGQAILAEFVSMGVKKTTSWIAQQATELMVGKSTEAAKLAAVTAGQTAKTAAVTTGAADTVPVVTAEATTAVTGHAAGAAAGAASAVAPIPVVGPGMALAAFAAVLGTVLAAKSLIKSSAGGEWQVPNDRLNIVHKDETILPAHIAGPLRNMVEGGGSTGGGHTINITAMDSRDVHRALMTGGALHKALTGLNRNFTTVK